MEGVSRYKGESCCPLQPVSAGEETSARQLSYLRPAGGGVIIKTLFAFIIETRDNMFSLRD